MSLSLEVIEASEVVGSFPEPVVIGVQPIQDFDLCVFPLGFEDRAIACARRMGASRVSTDRILILEYPQNVADNEARWADLEAALQLLNAQSATRVKFAPAGLLQRLKSEIVECGVDVPRVFFDISGASNSLLLDVVWALCDLGCDLTVGYAAAREYFPNRAQVLTDSGRLKRRPTVPEPSEGTGELRIDINHTGRFTDSGQDHIIMIPGFDRDRCRKVINSVDPTLLSHDFDRVHWILGDPLRPADSWRRDYQRMIHSESGCGAVEERLYSCSTYKYRDMLMVLETIYLSLPKSARITLSPMGSKMQAIGCALFCLARPEVRVKFALPIHYSTRFYSTGETDPVMLAFGDASEVARLTRSIGALRIRDDRGQIVLDGYERRWS